MIWDAILVVGICVLGVLGYLFYTAPELPDDGRD